MAIAFFASVSHTQLLTSCGAGSNIDIACLSSNAQYTLSVRVLSVGNTSNPSYDAEMEVSAIEMQCFTKVCKSKTIQLELAHIG